MINIYLYSLAVGKNYKKNMKNMILTYIVKEMVAGSNDREEASAQKSPLSIAASLSNIFWIFLTKESEFYISLTLHQHKSVHSA